MAEPASGGEPEACPVCAGEGTAWFEKRGHLLFRCTRCDTGYLPRSAQPDDPSVLYSSAYFEGETEHGYPTYRRDVELARRNFAQRLAWIERLHPPGRVLDVGAAYGYFLEAARTRGWQAEGVEIAPDCAAEAERTSGAKVVAGDFMEVPLESGFDVITMFDVLEHIADPMGALRRAHELLAPGGLVVVETGDWQSTWARALGARWYFFDPPQHVVYFSAESLERAMRRAGFTGAIRHARLGRRVSFANVAFKLLGGRAPELPGSAYLNFGDGLIVAATR